MDFDTFWQGNLSAKAVLLQGETERTRRDINLSAGYHPEPDLPLEIR